MEVYLDNSATTQTDQEVVDLMVKVLRKDYGNPSALHQKGMDAEAYLKEARERIARTLKAKSREIVFTSGGTEGNNLLVRGAAHANHRAGRHILTSPFEHACVYESMRSLAEEGFEIENLKVDGDGRINLEELRSRIRPDTILVSIMQINNEIGALQPLEELGPLIKAVNPNCLFHTDAVQSYGKEKIIPKDMGIDLLAASGHKIHGPKGSGFVYIKDKCRVEPLLLGGGQERGLRSGTENTAAIAGLGLAAEKICANLEEEQNRLYALKEHMVKSLSKIPGLTVNGRTGRDSAPQIISVSLAGVRAEVMLHALEERGVYVSAGSACSSNHPRINRTLQAIGLNRDLLDSTIRISLSVYTTMEEIDYACDCMEQLMPVLARFRRH